MDRKFSDWSGDPLRQEFANQATLRGLITAAGGAVPVTVETVVEEGHVLYFSRRNQRATWSSPREGTLSQGQLLGALPDDVHVLIRVGAALLKVRLDRLVSGLPPKNFHAAVKSLQSHKVSFWLRYEPGGGLRSGLFGESSNAQIVASALVVCDGEDVLLGMICQARQSQALYWLPGDRVGWTKLTADQMRQIFVQSQQRRIFRACCLEKTGCISLIDVPDVKSEFQQAAVGNEIAIQQLTNSPVVHEEAGLKRVLVETVGSKIILECELYENAEVTPAAEVILRNRRVVRVIPWGKRRFQFDLPAKFAIKLKPPSGSILDAESLSVVQQDALSDEELDNLLRLLDDRDQHEHGTSLRAIVQTAKSWLRRLPKRPEVQAEVGLRAMLIIHRKSLVSEEDLSRQLHLPIAECRQFSKILKGEARFLAQELGRRAQRSIHIEALTRFWRGDEERRGDQHDLWKRLNAYILKQLDHPHDRDATSFQAIRSFWEAVRLRDPEVMARAHIDAIADALLACTGEFSNMSGLYSDGRTGSVCAPVTHALLTVLRTLPESKSGMQLDLQHSHEHLLSRALDTILASGVDITLLRPIYGVSS